MSIDDIDGGTPESHDPRRAEGRELDWDPSIGRTAEERDQERRDLADIVLARAGGYELSGMTPPQHHLRDVAQIAKWRKTGVLPFLYGLVKLRLGRNSPN